MALSLGVEMTLPASLLKPLIVTAALLLGVAAQAQQASFTVSITLLSAPKAMAATQLCQEARTPSLVATSFVRVDCPAVADDKTATSQSTGTLNSRTSYKPTEVLVTF